MGRTTGHPAGGRTRDPRGSHLTFDRHHRRGFFAVMAACGGIVYFGLEGGGLHLPQLLLFVSAVVVALLFASARRRRVVDVARDHPAGKGSNFPKPSVVVRRLGETGESPLWSNRWTVE